MIHNALVQNLFGREMSALFLDTLVTTKPIVSIFSLLLQNSKVPDDHKDTVISHVVATHESVGTYSKLFLQKLRRVNYVTPKNYLDFIGTYVRLLEEKDQFVLEQVRLVLILKS